MKMHKLMTIAALMCAAFTTGVQAQTNVITYQGHLSDGGSPASGLYDLSFELFTDPVAGSSWAAATNAAVSVSNGLFTVQIDVGPGVFDGTDLWMELGAVTNSGGAFTTLSPRQHITSAPYAIKAASVDAGGVLGTLGSLQIADGAITTVKLNSNAVTSVSISDGTVTGTDIADGTVTVADLDTAVVSNTFWRIDGNAGTSGGTNFIGTLDNQPLDLRVNNTRALRLEYPTISVEPNIIGGHSNNSIAAGTAGAIIAAGENNIIGVNSYFSAVGGGSINAIGDSTSYGTISGGNGNDIGINSEASTVSGGAVNKVADNTTYGTISGGYFNDIGVNSDYSAVGGGRDNNISSNTAYAVIAGGFWNGIGASSFYSLVSGGRENTIEASSWYATVTGGRENKIRYNSDYSSVGGGYDNEVSSNTLYAAIQGGLRNYIGMSSHYSIVAGGAYNDIGDGAQFAYAAGTRAKANHTGAFVWADSTGLDFASSTNDEFAVRASGGVRFETGGAGIAVDGSPVLAGAGSVGGTEIATDAVGSDEISSGAVGVSELADGATLAEILDDDGAGSGLDADLLDGFSSSSFWKISGNLGTTPGVHYIGTADNQPLDFRVNSTRGLRIEYPTVGTVPNLIGGAISGSIGAGTEGAIIAAGSFNDIGANSDYSLVGGGYNNNIASNASYVTISGGYSNDIGDNADYSAVGGGRDHTIAANSFYGAIPGGLNNGVGAGSSYGTVGGGVNNNIGDSVHYSTIAGGYNNDIGADSDSSTVGGGENNNIADSTLRATIAGGYVNDIGVDADYSAVGGGRDNNISSNTLYAAISGGYINDIGYNSHYSTVGGGYNNNIADHSYAATMPGGYLNDIGENSDYSTVGGGYNNNVASDSWYTSISGGLNNDIGINSDYSTVGGGSNNSISSNTFYATISGGVNNDIGADSDYSTVGGGSNSDVGDGAIYAYAAGYRAKANHTGSFVWADSTAADFASITNDEFAVQAAGGMRVVGSSTNSTLMVAPNETSSGDDSQILLAEDHDGSFGMFVRYDGGLNEMHVFGKSGTTVYGPHLAIERNSSYVGIGTSPAYPLHMASGARCTTGGVWTDASSRVLKENFAPVDGGEILSKLRQLEVTQWNYKSEEDEILHVGPMAEDFFAAFGLGGMDDAISSTDRGGIALVAIQELARENVELQQRNDALEQRLVRLEELLESKLTGVVQ